MANKISNGSISFTSSLACELTFVSHGLVKQFQAALVSEFETDLQRTSSLSLNLETLEIPWTLGATYSFTIGEGFVKDVSKGIEEDSPPASISFTAPSQPASFQSSVPANSSTGVLENVTFILNYDRRINRGAGNIYLYKNGSPDSLIYTINMSNTSRVSVIGSQILLNVTGQFQQGNTYYMLADIGIVKDVWNFNSNAITNEDTIKFTMATAVEDTGSILKEASNITTQRRYLQDTGNNLFNNQTTYLYDQNEWTFTLTNSTAFTSSQYKFGNASYACSTAGHLSAVPSTPSSITGDYTIEYWYKTPTTADSGTIFDTRDASNTSSATEVIVSVSSLNEVDGVAGVWVGHSICNIPAYIFQRNSDGWVHIAFVKSGSSLKSFRNGVLVNTRSNFTNPLDLRSTGIHLGANYVNGFPAEGWIDDFKISSSAKYSENFTPPTSQAVGDVEDYVFLVNCNLVNNLPYYYITKRINNKPIVITDLDIDSGLTYSVTLTCNFGQISYNGNTGYSLTVSGTKEEVNSMFNVIGFTPNTGVTTNGYVNYIQKRNGETRETGAFLLTCIGAPSAPAAPQGLYVYTSNGTFTPPADLLAPGVKADILLVGGGGGGANGGGGGGRVITLLNQTLTNQTYTITVGAGGSRVVNTTPNSEIAASGGSTTGFGQTALGGSPGKESTATVDMTQKPDGGASQFAAGTGWAGYWTYSPNFLGGALNAGGGGGGAGGAGQTSYTASPVSNSLSGPTVSSAAGGSGVTSTVYPGTFGAGGGGGYFKAWTSNLQGGDSFRQIGTGTYSTEYGSGGAGGYYVNNSPANTEYVTSGDGYATSGKPGIVVIRFHT